MITFCKIREPYGHFSNFSPHPIKFENLIYPTSEHLYQSMKFQDSKTRELIRLSISPFEAAKLGRSLLGMIPHWDNVKIDVMRKVIALKIDQYPEIKELLISTGNEEIVEYSAKDYFWGSGPDFSGRNELGKIWMYHRELLKRTL